MNSIYNVKKNWLAGLMFALLPLPAWSAMSLSDVPLFLTSAVHPNVIFTLDDSGSMQFEIMPEGLITKDVRFVYPVRTGTYGDDTYSNYVVGFDANNDYTAKLRSSHVNKIYYNPEVRYLPWSKADGSLMDNASVTCAPHNPWLVPNKNDPTKDCRNLTENNTANVSWLQSNNTLKTESQTFFPAVYFQYKGSGSIDSAGSYTQVEIRSGKTYTGGLGRTDCAAVPICTYDEEIQNFANWYTYYRSRVLLARAGAGRAFAAQNKNMRAAFGAINKGSTSIDGVSTETLITGVRLFDGADKADFFDKLYGHTIPAQGTPLRTALKGVGEYLRRNDAKGPWSDKPGVGGTDSIQPVCRQNYHILMTDGYWNDSYTGVNNADGSDGTAIINGTANATPATYQYKPALPYKDGYKNTLADVAMYYWKTDLRTDLANRVPANAKDPAFWQHLVNFTVGLGVQGSLTSLPGSAGGPAGWPNPTATETAKIDDLWHAAVNSRGEFFSAQDPATFATGLTNALTNITARISSAAAVTTNTSRLNTGAQIYQAKFNSADWSGQLLAFNLQSDASLGALQWEASEQLPAHSNRSILTHNGTTALAFTAANFSSLSAAQQAALNKNISGVNDGKGIARIGWLRGDKATEIVQGGTFRNRNNGVLGDIVNSDLLHIKSLDFGYDFLPAGTPGQSSYHTFRKANNSRTPVIYTGANEGMLHAFNAETGVELFAYVPSTIYSDLSRLTSTSYTHRYLVDGNAYAGDAYIGTTPAWKTVLLGTLGGGGKSVFALDITDPVHFSASNVLWEFTDADLGFIHGQAKIARLNNGAWAAIIGNGYNSTGDKAFLFIVDLQTGALIKKIPTNSSTSNGLSTPALVDINDDKTIDYIYAGDLQGNVWKFDLSQTDSAQWSVAYKSGCTGLPLFTARNGSNQVQPITSPLEIGYHLEGSVRKAGYMIYFGTGQFVASGDTTDKKIQSLYGIWDRNDGSSSRIPETDRSVLQSQAILTEITTPSPQRTSSSNPVDWTTRRGWYIDLQRPDGTKEGERSVVMPMLNFGRVIFTTLIPSVDPCEAGGRNWLMLLNAETGGMIQKPQFDTNGDGKLNSNDGIIAAVGSEGIRSESVAISAGSVTHLIAATTTGNVEKVTISNAASAARRSWKQIQ